jgi:cytochrome d ubiquinol oxidase subunit I
MSLEDLSRWQFALTIIFHMIFPAITVGLSIFLSIVYAMYWRTKKPIYLQMFRFWRRIFAVGFALGVVAGAVITFEMGLNWGVFGAKTGAIIGPIIGMEVVTAFFVEAGFIGIMLYGDSRVRKGTMFASTVMVAIGTLLSTTWIMVANSWMQTPAGFAIVNGNFVPTDWWQVIFNPSFGLRFTHMVIGALVASSLFITGLSAYYLVKGRAVGLARRSLSIGLGVATLLLPLQLYVGDAVASDVVAHYQFPKLLAIEGNWTSTNTGWNLFVIPDQQTQTNLVQITVPWLESAIGKDLTGHTPIPGLSTIPKADQPAMAPTFWGFRIMFYSSLFMFASIFIGMILRIRNKLWEAKRFHKYLLWTTPAGIVAILAGWVTSEAGRQPWVVYGQLRTSTAVSHLASGELVFSVIGFVAIYLALLVTFIVYVVRTVKIGPERDDPRLDGIEPHVPLLDEPLDQIDELERIITVESADELKVSVK